MERRTHKRYEIDAARLQRALENSLAIQADGDVIICKGYDHLAYILYGVVDNALSDIPETIDLPL